MIKIDFQVTDKKIGDCTSNCQVMFDELKILSMSTTINRGMMTSTDKVVQQLLSRRNMYLMKNASQVRDY